VKVFQDRIKRPMLQNSFEKRLMSNWRYLVNYYGFVQRLFEYIEKEEMILDIMPLCIKSFKSNYCPLPVKKFIAEAMANTIG
jgi:hypothetical protein